MTIINKVVDTSTGLIPLSMEVNDLFQDGYEVSLHLHAKGYSVCSIHNITGAAVKRGGDMRLTFHGTALDASTWLNIDAINNAGLQLALFAFRADGNG